MSILSLTPENLDGRPLVLVTLVPPPDLAKFSSLGICNQVPPLDLVPTLSHAPIPGLAPAPPQPRPSHLVNQAPPLAWSLPRSNPTLALGTHRVPPREATRISPPFIAGSSQRPASPLLPFFLNPYFPAPEAPPPTLCAAQKPEAGPLLRVREAAAISPPSLARVWGEFSPPCAPCPAGPGPPGLGAREAESSALGLGGQRAADAGASPRRGASSESPGPLRPRLRLVPNSPSPRLWAGSSSRWVRCGLELRNLLLMLVGLQKHPLLSFRKGKTSLPVGSRGESSTWLWPRCLWISACSASAGWHLPQLRPLLAPPGAGEII